MAKLVGARVYNNATIEIANETETQLTFNSERYDYDAIHNPGSNPSRLTATTAGIYVINGTVMWENNADAIRFISIWLNGATYLCRGFKAGIVGWNTEHEITTIYELAATEYVELRVYQNSGGALDIYASGNISPEFMMHRIG
jgi:hypothetical protein